MLKAVYQEQIGFDKFLGEESIPDFLLVIMQQNNEQTSLSSIQKSIYKQGIKI